MKIGDRVRLIKGIGTPIKIGTEGIVRSISGDDIGVSFNEFRYGHNLYGQVSDGSGWWVKKNDLELISNNPTIEEAKLRYPIGTVYEDAANPDLKDRMTVESHNWEISSRADRIFGELGKGCVYFEGKWAKILSEPVESKETKTFPDNWFVVPETEANLKLIKKHPLFSKYSTYIITHRDNAYTSDGVYYTHSYDIPRSCTRSYTQISMKEFIERFIDTERYKIGIDPIHEYPLVPGESISTSVSESVDISLSINKTQSVNVDLIKTKKVVLF